MDLKKIRLEKQMTQIQVAKACGVSLVSYRNWEDGVTTPSDENMKKLELVLTLVRGRGGARTE